jgi:hypothetical protein
MTGKITSYGADTAAKGDDIIIEVDPDDTTMASTGTDKKMTVSVLGKEIEGWADLCRDYGADKTGGTSIATAMADACADAASNSGTTWGVTVPPGIYKVTAPWNGSNPLPPNLRLKGAGITGNSTSGRLDGTVFAVDSSFSGAEVIQISDVAHATVNGPHLSGFGISGVDYTAAAVDAISVTGPAMTKLSDITILEMSGGGLNTHPDLSANEIGAYGMIVEKLFIDSCAGIGARLVYVEDSQFTFCYIIGCGLDNWQVCGCDNTHFTDCRAEWSSGGYGLHITNITDGGTPYDWTYATGTCNFNNFSTDANYQSGIRCDATWATGSGVGTGPCKIMFTSPQMRRDGKQYNDANGSWAGIDVDYSGASGASAGLPVYVNGIDQTTGVPDGGSGNMGPRYGIRANALGSAPFRIAGTGQAWGYTAAAITSGTVTNYSLASTVDQITGNNYSYTG